MADTGLEVLRLIYYLQYGLASKVILRNPPAIVPRDGGQGGVTKNLWVTLTTETLRYAQGDI